MLEASDVPADGKIYAQLTPEGDYTLTVSNKGKTVSGKPSGNSFALGNESEYWLVNGEVMAAGETVTLTADTTAYALAVSLLDGASVRAAAQSGLRFETVIDAGLYGALEELDYEVGTLIVPTDLLGSNAFTAEALDAAGVDYLELVSSTAGVKLASDGDGNKTFYAAIVDILAQNYARAFSAISYIELDGVRVYTDYSAAKNSRSVYGVAAAAGEGGSDAAAKYLGGVVEIVSGAQVMPYDGFAHPLTATVSEGVLTVTGEGLTAESLKTVILDGEIYTDGWNFADGKFTATLPTT